MNSLTSKSSSISMISVQSKCPNRKCSKLPHPPTLAPTVLINQLCTQDTKAKSSNFFLAFTVDRWVSHTNIVSHFSKTSLSIRHQCKSCSKLATPFYQNIQLLMVSKNSLQKDHDKVENGKKAQPYPSILLLQSKEPTIVVLSSK